MASTCQNKEAAWDFIRQLVRSRYNLTRLCNPQKAIDTQIPVNLKDYKLSILAVLERTKQLNLEKDPTALPPGSIFSDDSYPFYPEDKPSEEDIPRYEALINNTTQIYWPNDTLANVVWEAAGPYFAGDKTLDEAVDLIQRRVTLYVNENR